ncbi:MAG: SMP-30/gluconolactonase/LRE family protein [Flavisolibacter sp.]|nr:SMP-30/gluconolactonase/LRE family protein [Flavisolibacter sp.]
MKASLYIILLLLLFSQESEAQIHDIKFHLITGKYGMVLGKINGIAQDPSGYMWFADQTQRCITRYDGYSMLSFRNDPLNNNSLGGTYPECIFADPSGIIWIGFYGMGLDRFDPETGKFTHFRHQPNDPASLNNDSVTAILMDHLGNLWIGNYGGLDLLDAKTGTFKHYSYNAKDSTSLSSNRIRALYEDRQGTLWVGTGTPFETAKSNEGGLNRFNRETATFTRYLHDPKSPGTLINNQVRAIFEDSKGTFWVGTSGDGLHTMDRATGVFKRLTYNPAHPERLSRPPVKDYLDDHITFITEDATGALWIGTFKEGLTRYDPTTKTLTRFSSNSSTGSGFNDNSCWLAYTSRDNVLWVSTEPQNLYRMNPLHITIPRMAATGVVNSFFQDADGVLWMGTDAGLIRHDRNKKSIKRFTHDPLDQATISNDNIMSISKDNSGNLWIGTYGGGLNKLEAGKHTFTHYRHNPQNNNSLISDIVFKTYADQEGSLWISTTEGLDQLNVTTGTFTHYQHNRKDTNSLSNNSVIDVIQDRRKRIWVSTYYGGGVNVMDPDTHRFKHHLSGLDVNCLYQDSDGVIWAGTIGGLYRFNNHKGTFVIFTDPGNEVRYNHVTSIIEDNEKALWMGTSEGIIRLNAQRDVLTIYGKNHGVENSLNLMAAYKGLSNELFFGAATGYYNFFPQRIVQNIKPPEVLLSDFRLSNKPVKPGQNSPLHRPLTMTEKIVLSHKQNTFSFDFAAIDYRNPEENRILFMLENYDPEWHRSGSEHTAYYYNVPPGDYIFKVKVAGSEGAWTEKSITIIIAPPWWQAWWAYCVYGILLTATLYAIHRIQKQRMVRAERERTRKREWAQAKEIEKAYEQLKTTQTQLIQSEKMASLGELIAGIAHEIQNPLNFVNNFSEVNTELLEELEREMDKRTIDEVKAMAADIKRNEQKINHYGKRADAIVKSMLQHARTGAGQKEPFDINALANEYLQLSYHGMRAKDKAFNAQLQTDFDPNVGKVAMVPQDMGRVLLNLFNNALYAVHEKKKKLNGAYEPAVAVTTKKAGDKVEIHIKDNGTGIPEGQLGRIFQPFFTTKPMGEGTGLGLSLSYDIVTKGHGGELKVETKEGEYTEFVISLPLYERINT